MRGRLGTLLLAIAASAFACAAAEIALRLAGYEPLYEVYSKPELFWRHDERLGWSLDPGARGRYRGPRPFPVEYDSAIEINSLGLRGPEIGPPEPGELRVLVLGDSFVAGFEVEHEETFVALLEKKLRRRLSRPIHAINAGVRGYGTDQSLMWFRDSGRQLGAHVVVLVFSGNDFEDNVTLHRSRRPFGKGAFALRPSGSLELVGVPVPRYPLCSAWVLDETYAPARVDGALSRASCFLQTRAADHSALFTFVALALARIPILVKFLEEATEPAEEQPTVHASMVPWPAGPVRIAGLLPDFGRRDRNTALESELTTALLQALAREVRSSGALFLPMIGNRHLAKLDRRALAADRIEPLRVVLMPGIDRSRIRFRNDAHMNELGHEVYADGLAQLVEAELKRGSR